MKIKTIRKFFYVAMVFGFLFLGTTNVFAALEQEKSDEESQADGKVLCSDLGVNVEGEPDAMCDILF